MILRRLSSALRHQEWTTIVIEFVLVITGVLIALQVDNWNGDRQLRGQRALIESRLRNDFELIDEAMALSTANHAEIIEALHTLKRAIARGEALQEEDAEIELALNRGFEYWQVSYRSGTFIELLSSGRLDLITDEGLRIALIRYDRTSQQGRFNLEQIRNNLHPDIGIFGSYKELGPLTRNDDGQIVLSPVVDFDIEGMAADKEFRAVLNQMLVMQTWIQLNMNGLRAEFDRLSEEFTS